MKTPTNKKCQNLTISLVTENKDCFGIYDLTIRINKKEYTYSLNSEFMLRKIKKQIINRRFGSALKLLKLCNVRGKEVDNDSGVQRDGTSSHEEAGHQLTEIRWNNSCAGFKRV